MEANTKLDSAYARPSLPKEETNGQKTSLHEGMMGSDVHSKTTLMIGFLKEVDLRKILFNGFENLSL